MVEASILAKKQCLRIRGLKWNVDSCWNTVLRYQYLINAEYLNANILNTQYSRIKKNTCSFILATLGHMIKITLQTTLNNFSTKWEPSKQEKKKNQFYQLRIACSLIFSTLKSFLCTIFSSVALVFFNISLPSWQFTSLLSQSIYYHVFSSSCLWQLKSN